VSAEAPRIVLFTDGGDWHRTQLLKAFRARGVEVVTTSLASCALATESPSGIVIPGFADRLPDAALVRSVSAGGFEQITLRLGVLHGLAACGVPVWNEARAIERCVDKAMTSFLLAKAGIPTPPTVATEDAALARDLVRGWDAQVLKPLFGAQGRGLRRIEAGASLPPEQEIGGVYYLQAFIAPTGPGYEDRRVLVSAGRVVGTMLRRSRSWITNIRQGGTPVSAEADETTAALALRAAAAVGARFAGVDIIRDRDGQALVLEVNSMPAWRGLQEVCEVNIAGVLADDVLAGLTTR
jgi:tetrahydromethanopterin:alpha-L-glutamate ligase